MNTLGGLLTAGLISLAMCAMAAAATDSRVLMEEMTTTEVRDAIQAGKTTVLIFNASTEASGPHLVLGKHVYRARYLGERIRSRTGQRAGGAGDAVRAHQRRDALPGHNQPFA